MRKTKRLLLIAVAAATLLAVASQRDTFARFGSAGFDRPGPVMNAASTGSRSVKPTRNARLPKLNAVGQTRLTAEGTVVDEHGIIITPPQGATHYYKRSGKSYYYDSDWHFYSGVNQTGHVTVVDAADGAVYIKDIIAYYPQNAWVKGMRDGSTITIPVGQPVAYNTQYDMTLSLFWGAYDDNGWGRSDKDAITFTVGENTLTLADSDEDHYIGAFWDGGNRNFSGWGDYATVWTLDDDYVPASLEPVELPAGLAVQSWYAEGQVYQGEHFERTVSVAFDGNEVYVKGIFTTFPDSWIKGVAEGGKVTFAGNQFLGYAGGVQPVWAAGYDSNGLCDIRFTFDAEANEYDSDVIVLANGSDERVVYVEALSDFSFMPSKPVPAVVNELPYSNDFDTKARRRAFTVLDNNGDNSTWQSGVHAHTGTGMYYYEYNASNDGDDWLMSPPIKLEAGRVYSFSMNAWAEFRTSPERVEVKLGKAATAQAMTQQVVAPTTVDQTVFESVVDDAMLLGNDSITVDETGYYYVGIHAISDKDMLVLYVDNFRFDLSVSPLSPAAVSDLTVAQTHGQLEATVSFTAPTTALNGQPLSSNLPKIILLRDGVEVASISDVAPGSRQSIVDNSGLSLGVHHYQVIAYSDYGRGEEGEPAMAFISLPVSVPALFDMTASGIHDRMLIIDANGDNRTWSWQGSSGYCYYFNHNAADEYLVAQPVSLEAGKSYHLLLSASTKSDPERLEVKYGKGYAVDELNLTAIEPTILKTNEVSQDLESDFEVTESGDYYFAVHAISDPDCFELHVTKLVITQNAAADGPAAPVVTVEADSLGYTRARVTVEAPTEDINGNALTGNLSKVECYRDDNTIFTAHDVTPGQTLAFVDSTATVGTHTYHALAYSTEGNPGVASNKVTLYVGQDTPKAIYSVRYGDNVDGYTLMWDKVDSVGRNGGHVNPALVDYVVSQNVVKDIAGVAYDAAGDELGRVRDGDRFTFTGLNTDEGEQRFVPYYVRTENVAGATRDYQKYLIIGAPYELPFEENFADKQLHRLWDYNDETAMLASDDASDGDSCALGLGPTGVLGLAEFETGKINFRGTANPVLTFDMKRGETSETEMDVYAVLPDGSHIALQTVPINDDYTTFEVPLGIEPILTARFARIGFSVNFAPFALRHYVLLDNIKITERIKKGDVNADGEVDVKDVNILINIILNKDSALNYGERAYLTEGDSEIDVADINALINLILAK